MDDDEIIILMGYGAYHRLEALLAEHGDEYGFKKSLSKVLRLINEKGLVREIQ
jgi:hypothetical protein